MPSDSNLTIYDIARLAGVSKSTVSRVLNQRSDVDAETRAHVLRVMEEHGFVASLNASGLKGRSQLVGIFVPALSWSIVTETLLGISRVLENSPYDIVLYSCPPEKEYHETIKRIMTTRLTAGIVAVIHNQSPEPLEALFHRGIPTVVVNHPGYALNIPSINADNITGAYEAIRHLLHLGYRRIAFLHGPAHFPCSQKRFEGYLKALHEVGLEPDPALILHGEYTIDSGRDAGKYLLQMEERPEAIFTGNDASAWGILDVAEERGVRVPEELAVVGFDDAPQSIFMRPALTTVRQPFAEMGGCGAELLLSMLNPQHQLSPTCQQYILPQDTSAHGSKQAIQLCLPTQLIVRGSCGAPGSLRTRQPKYA